MTLCQLSLTLKQAILFVTFPCKHFLQDFSPPYINILNLSIVGQSLENFKETYFTIELNSFCSKVQCIIFIVKMKEKKPKYDTYVAFEA